MRSLTAIIIPARLGSNRVQRKMLEVIEGKSVIQRSYERAAVAKNAFITFVATDSEEIADHLKDLNYKSMVIPGNFANGTERVSWAARLPICSKADIIINVQGDEILFDSEILDEMVDLLQSDLTISAVTCYKKRKGASDAHTVKLIRDEHGNLLDLNRDITEEDDTYNEHVGIYAFRKEGLHRLMATPLSKDARRLDIEGIRMIDSKLKVIAIEHKGETLSVNTHDDLRAARKLFSPDTAQVKKKVKRVPKKRLVKKAPKKKAKKKEK